MSRILAIESDDEMVSQMCRTFRDAEVYPALDPVHTVEHFEGAATPGATATRADIKPAVDAVPVDFITGSGHGFPERFTGQNRDPVFAVGGYAPSEVAGTIIHLLSCETAQQLGVDVVANGCRAFFGYDAVFVFPDQAGRFFLESDAQIDLALAQGKTAEEAYDAAAAMFRKRIAQLLQTGNVFVAAALKRNLNHLCSPKQDPKWGDPAAKLK